LNFEEESNNYKIKCEGPVGASFSPLHIISTLSDGYQGLFPPGVKQLGHEADHSPAFSAEV
jgi:hypothetical protein